MALDRQFIKLMTDRIVVDHFTASSTDGYNVRTYSTSSTYYARIEQRVQLVKDSTSRDSVSTVTIYTPTTDRDGTTVSIGLSDQLTLPAGYSGRRNPPILWVERHNDDRGPMYQKVYV